MSEGPDTGNRRKVAGMTTYTLLSPAAPTPETTASVLSQLLPEGVRLDWSVAVPRPDAPLPDDPRVRPVVIPDMASRPLTEVINQMAADDGTGELVRPIWPGDRLLPGALSSDASALSESPWCTSEALDDISGAVIPAAIPSAAGPVARGTVLDSWADSSPHVPVHPGTLALRTEVFAACRGFALDGYGALTDLLARANERYDGHHTGRPSVVRRELYLRPEAFDKIRRDRTSALLGLRIAPAENTDPAALINDRAFWDRISAQSWETHNVDEPGTSDFPSLLRQCRKLHYRFDWEGLDTLGTEGLRSYDDGYLRLMVLTARAALGQGWEEVFSLNDALGVDVKLSSLVLTAMFESGERDPQVLREGVAIATSILAVDPEHAVTHYRMVTLHRLLGDREAAVRWSRRTAAVLSRLSAPALADHLRERLIVENTALSAME